MRSNSKTKKEMQIKSSASLVSPLQWTLIVEGWGVGVSYGMSLLLHSRDFYIHPSMLRIRMRIKKKDKKSQLNSLQNVARRDSELRNTGLWRLSLANKSCFSVFIEICRQLSCRYSHPLGFGAGCLGMELKASSVLGENFTLELYCSPNPSALSQPLSWDSVSPNFWSVHCEPFKKPLSFSDHTTFLHSTTEELENN